MITFRWYSVNHGVLSELPGQKDHYNAIVDRAFIYIHENFIDGKFPLFWIDAIFIPCGSTVPF